MGGGMGLGMGPRTAAGTPAPTPTPTPQPSPPTTGDDVFVAITDSLGPGTILEADRDPVLDAATANTRHYVLDFTRPDYGSIAEYTLPIWFNQLPGGEAYISPFESVVRRYQAITSAWGRGSAVMPTGRAGAALFKTPTAEPDFDPFLVGGHLANARNNHNNGFGLLKVTRPHSRVRGVLICLNSNGNDVEYDHTENRAGWIALIDYIRANFDGISDETPFALAGPCGAFTEAGLYRDDIAYVATQRTNCYVVQAPGTQLHPFQADNRTWGVDLADAFYAAPEPATVDDFAIAPVNGAAVDTDIDSAAVMVMVGYNVAVTASISGGEFSIDGGAFSSASRTVYWGNEIVVRKRSSASVSTTVTATLTIGTKSADFSVTTPTTRVVSLDPGSLYFDNGQMRSASGRLLLETI